MKRKSHWFGISTFCFVKIHKYAYVLRSWKKIVFSWTSEPCRSVNLLHYCHFIFSNIIKKINTEVTENHIEENNFLICNRNRIMHLVQPIKNTERYNTFSLISFEECEMKYNASHQIIFVPLIFFNRKA